MRIATLGVSIVAAIGLGLLSTNAALAQRSQVEIRYAGTVFSINATVFFAFQEIGVSVGSPFSSTLVLDANAVDLFPDDPTVAPYSNAILSWTFQVGPWSASFSPPGNESLVSVFNQTRDIWSAGVRTGFVDEPDILGDTGFGGTGFSFTLIDNSGSVLISDSILLPNAIDPALLQSRTFGQTQLIFKVSSFVADASEAPD